MSAPRLARGWFSPLCVAPLDEDAIAAPTVWPVVLSAVEASRWYWLADRIDVEIEWTGGGARAGSVVLTRENMPTICTPQPITMMHTFEVTVAEDNYSTATLLLSVFPAFGRALSDTKAQVRPQVSIEVIMGGSLEGATHSGTAASAGELDLHCNARLNGEDGVELPMWDATAGTPDEAARLTKLIITPLFL